MRKGIIMSDEINRNFSISLSTFFPKRTQYGAKIFTFNSNESTTVITYNVMSKAPHDRISFRQLFECLHFERFGVPSPKGHLAKLSLQRKGNLFLTPQKCVASPKKCHMAKDFPYFIIFTFFLTKWCIGQITIICQLTLLFPRNAAWLTNGLANWRLLIKSRFFGQVMKWHFGELTRPSDAYTLNTVAIIFDKKLYFKMINVCLIVSST